MSDVKFGTWSAQESPVAIEYSLVVIEEIRQEVTEGFQKLSRGGVEVGGALYGTRDGRSISIQAMRPILCEHARGPAFILSDNDKRALEEQLQRDPEDPRLEGMECLGWFLSHTRSDVMLSDSDLEIYTGYFGALWQVTMVVRPGRGGAMRAGFFVREQDGTVKCEKSYLEFSFPDRLAGVLDRPPRSDRMPGERRAAPPRRNEDGLAPPLARNDSPRLPQAAWDGPQLLPSPPPRAKWPWLVGWAALVIILAVVGIRYFLLPSHVEPVGLNVTERDGQLQIDWNRASRSVTGAARGSLVIVDGKETHTLPLAPRDLSKGNFSYQRSSGDVEVRMTVETSSGEKTEDASRFLGQPPAKGDSEELKTLQQERDQLTAEVERLRRENAAQNERIQQLDRTLRILQTRLGIAQ
jgi:proteasome lid subunit RPN8/RPN11